VKAHAAGQSALLLLDAEEVLRREGIDYVVIGAFALAVLGTVRASMDVDVLLSVSRERLTKLRARFEAAGFKATLRHGDADDPIPSLLKLSDEHGNLVELLGGLKGLDPKLFDRAVQSRGFHCHEVLRWWPAGPGRCEIRLPGCAGSAGHRSAAHDHASLWSRCGRPAGTAPSRLLKKAVF
jgi:hypothetical protein